MKVKSIYIKNFRNISSLNAEFCEGVNIIYGENAQGKTNILESLWAFTGTKSFRTGKEAELIKFGEDFAQLKTEFFSGGREQQAQIDLGEKKSVYLNGIKQNSVSRFNGKFYAVIFSPEHLSLVKGGPKERRKFIDDALCQIKPGFAEFLSKYKKNLSQRNALLKELRKNDYAEDIIEIFEKNLAHIGTKIIYQRKKYIEILQKKAYEIYLGFSGEKEQFSLSYESTVSLGNSEKETEQNFINALKEGREEDMYSLKTSYGPHRDDMEIKINGASVRKFASQGQQRSCVLALKLGEANVLKNKTGEMPIALLDDVMSELDEYRQNYILHNIEGWQVFITCCDPNTILKLKKGKSFEIKNGKIINEISN